MKAKSGDFEFEGTPEEIATVTTRIVSFARESAKAEEAAAKAASPVLAAMLHDAAAVVENQKPSRMQKVKFTGTRQEQALQVTKIYGTITAPMLAEKLDVTHGNATSLIKELHDLKQIERVARGEYVLTASGSKRIS